MLIVTLPYPPSANHYKSLRVVTPKGKRPFVQTYVTAEAEAYKTEVAWLLRAAGVRSPCPGRIAIDYTLYPKRPQDWQKRMKKLGEAWHDEVMCIDLDNAQKVLLDSLKGIAFDDDKWVREITARRAAPDDHGARMVVKIKPIRAVAPVVQPSLDLPEPAPLRLFDPLDV